MINMSQKMKKILNLLILIFCLGLLPALAEITKTSSLAPIESAIQQADSGTLVIFDVAEVLITPKDQILQLAHREDLDKLDRELGKRYSQEEIEKLGSIMKLSHSREVVDIKFLQLIHNLQKRGIKVIALTNFLTGPFGNIPSLEEWRIQDLESFGYTFKDSWKTLKPKIFGELKTKDPKRFPVFKNGVLFTSSLSKGEVLKAFLHYAGLSPKKIVFIDDKREYLESVEAFSKEAGIPFVGFEYTAVAERPKSPLNEKRAQLQFEVLEKEHKWLKDKEADENLKNLNP